MSLNSGTSIGMATLEGDDAKSCITFKKEPEEVRFDIADDYQKGGSGAQQYNIYPKDNSKVIELQTYFKNPSNNLKGFIDNKYEGPIDGNMSDDLIDLIKEVEDRLVDIFDDTDFIGSILRSSIEQIDEALGVANNKKTKKVSKDERIIQMVKILGNSSI